MAQGSLARSHWAMFGVVFLVCLIPVVLAEAAPPIHNSLPHQLLSELFQPNAAPPARADHAPIKLFPEVSPHQDQAGTPALKEGSSVIQLKHRWMGKHQALLSDQPAAQAAGCEKVGSDVTCYGASITKVPADLGNGTTTILFHGTSLTELPNGAFQNFTDLLQIIVSKNPLARVEAGAFRGISKLGQLGLVDNTLNTTTVFENSTFEGVSRLDQVAFINIGLKAVPEYMLNNATKVTELDLSGNQITSVETLPVSLHKLKWLSLDQNKISTIKASAFNYTRGIEVLYLGSNNLGSLDAGVLSDLMSLSVLDLSSNGMTTFDRNICNMSTTLTDLILGKNKLTKASFMGCSSVETLDISGNNIETLQSQAFAKMDNLKNLNIGGNQLDMLPNLGMILQLESLDISGNNITTIKSGEFNKYGNLKTLTARGMGTRLMVEKGALNLGLLSVDFSLNPDINVTTETLLSPPGIQNIYLHGCGIKQLNGTAIENKQSLKILDLSSNPMKCDCDARWMPKSRDAKKPWAMAWGVKTVSPRCGNPSYFQLDISELTVEDFACEVPKLEFLTPTNITVDWKANFNFMVNLTRGYPLGTWTHPPGEFSYEVGNDIYYTRHFVLTHFFVYDSEFKGTVTFTMVATNVVGSTKATFYVTQLPGPPSSASKGGPVNKFFFVVMMITTLLLRA